jgi:RND family efflux transporter MFP subunit
MLGINRITRAAWVAGSAMLVLGGCDQHVAAPVEAAVRPVKTMMLEDAAGIERNFPATIAASRRVDMSFRVPGRLKEMRVAEGDKVEAGQTLAELDPTDYQLTLDNAQAELDRATADWKRSKVLVVDGYLSRSEFDGYESTYRQAIAAAQQARLNLSYTVMKAPIRGTIAKRYIQNFEEVVAKQELFALRDNSELEVRVNIPESVVMRLTLLQETGVDDRGLWVSFSAAEDERYPLVIKEIATQADEATQTFQVRMTFDAPKSLNVLPGMSALVTAELSNLYADHNIDVKLPASAVDGRGEQPRLWIYDPGTGRASPRDVVIGPPIAGRVELMSGVDFGERIIVAGAEQLDDTMQLYEMRHVEQAQQ